MTYLTEFQSYAVSFSLEFWKWKKWRHEGYIELELKKHRVWWEMDQKLTLLNWVKHILMGILIIIRSDHQVKWWYSDIERERVKLGDDCRQQDNNDLRYQSLSHRPLVPIDPWPEIAYQIGLRNLIQPSVIGLSSVIARLPWRPSLND